MKKLFFVMAAAVLLLSGCTREVIDNGGDVDSEGEMQTVTFSVLAENQADTKASADGDGAGAGVNRCIMEIYYDGSLFKRDIQPVTHSGEISASFTATVVSGRTYTVAFWADHVTDNSTTGTPAPIASDLYYTTSAAQPGGGLQAIALNGTYIGNNDERDAFFGVKNDCTVSQTQASFDIVLKRPFAQMNVITTDWDRANNVSDIKPSNVDVTIKNPLTVFNALTGDASTDDNVSSLHYNETIYSSPQSGNEATLSMDYLFAAASKAVIDIDWKAQKSGTTDISHCFSNIPYQRNYRTNIKGELLTAQGQWNVTVDPIWGVPDTTVYIAATLAQAQAYVDIDPGEPVTVQVTEEAISNATLDDIVEVGGKKYLQFILKTTSPETVGFELPAITGELLQEAGVETWLVTYEENYPTKTVTVDAPSGSKLKIEAPTSHVEVPSDVYAEVTALTGDNTMVIPYGTTVTNLTVIAGGLEIHGTVTNLVIDTLGTGRNVYVRTSENLSQAVFDVICKSGEHDYIDRPWYEEIQEGSTWKIRPCDAELEISKNSQITGYTSMSAFRDYVNAGHDFSGYTVKMLKDVTLSDWSPIGSCDNNIAFSGTFDGDGKTITLSKSNISDTKYGLFAYLKGTSQNPVIVKDLNLAVTLSTDGSTQTRIGGLAALAEYAQFTGITVTGSIVAGHQAGGLTGWASCDASFTDCTNKASISVTVPASTGYSIFGGITAQAYGTATFTNCRNEGALTADHTSDSTADSYIGHIVGKGPYPNEGGSITMTDCSYNADATITGWNVLATDMNTYPFEGVISGQSRSTYFEQSNPGKLLIGGYFNKCSISGVETSWQYPNGVTHIQMTAAAYLSEMAAAEAEFGNAAAGRGFYYTTGEGTARIFYKSFYDKGQYDSKANYSEQFKIDEYICYVPLNEMATTIDNFGDVFNSSLTWAGGAPAAAGWTAYKTELANCDFSSQSDVCWSTGDSIMVHIYGTKVNDSTGKITIKTVPVGGGLGSTTNHNMDW